MKWGIGRAGWLALCWVLSGICVFFVGWSVESRPAPNDHQSSGHRGSSERVSMSASEEDSSSDGPRSSNRRSSSVGRFLSFTRRLSNDELSRLLPEVAEKMTLDEVREALVKLDELRPGPARRLARMELIARMAQLDAMATFAHIETYQDEELRRQLIPKAVKGWTSVDPAAAHAHVTNTAGFDKMALRAVWEGIAKTNDLERTLAFIPELGPGSNQYSEPYEIWDIYMTLHELYRKNDKQVLSWVENLPPGETRNRAFHSIVDQLARHDPLAAKEWIEEQADPSNIREAHVELAESWARHDPEAAVQWAANLPSTTDGLRRIYERLFTRFIQYDFLDAANYLVQQDPSPTLDTAFEVYIDKVKSIDPASTMDWAAAITDETRRWQAIQEVSTVWRGRDVSSFRAHVENMELSDDQRDALLGELR